MSSAPWRPWRCRREVQTRHLPGAAAINRVKEDESLSRGQARKEAARAELSGNPWVALGSLRGGTRTSQQQRAQCQGRGEEVTGWDGIPKGSGTLPTQEDHIPTSSGHIPTPRSPSLWSKAAT